MDEEKKLELRLGPPGEDWTQVKERREEHHHHHSINSVLSLGSFPNVSKNTTTNPCSGAKRGFFESQTEVFQHQKQQPGFLQLQTKTEAERKATVMHNSTQTRVGSTPVVGWPPIRSFRKNLASTSSKPSVESPDEGLETTTKLESSKKGLFVKINMDGIPIGRKVDLKAYDSYEKLSVAVDELFRDLLAAQSDATAAATQKRADKKKAIRGLLDGTGEYTLVYEDDEGDRMLVGDVPWEMFISMAKRLRVLKSSDLSKLSLGTINRRRAATDC